MAIKKQCEQCDKGFLVSPHRKNTARFCSYPCLNQGNRKPKVEKKCQSCDKKFLVIPARENSAKYCSQECYGKIAVNRMFTEKSIQKMTQRIREQYQNGRQTWNKGKVGIWSNPNKGEKSNLWKGGTSKLWQQIVNSVEYKVWRKEVFIRDRFQCTQCKSEVLIEADHIKAKSIIVREFLARHSELEDKEKVEAIKKYCTELWDINNGRTLCRECHSKTDNYAHKAIQQMVKHNTTIIWQHQ